MRLVSESVSSTEAVAVERRVAAPRRLRQRSEADLIRGAQAGREGDFELLFRRHWRSAYRTAFFIVHDHAAAEDIAQEAFVAAVRTLERFDRRRPFAPWLARIVTNRAIDWTRARAARHELDGAPLPAPEEATEAPVGYSPELLAALGTLSAEHRAVVVLRYVLDYTPGEIARTLALPRGTVNSRLRRALDALDAHLRDARW